MSHVLKNLVADPEELLDSYSIEVITSDILKKKRNKLILLSRENHLLKVLLQQLVQLQKPH